jgi:hypothetical protein
LNAKYPDFKHSSIRRHRKHSGLLTTGTPPGWTQR